MPYKPLTVDSIDVGGLNKYYRIEFCQNLVIYDKADFK